MLLGLESSGITRIAGELAQISNALFPLSNFPVDILRSSMNPRRIGGRDSPCESSEDNLLFSQDRNMCIMVGFAPAVELAGTLSALQVAVPRIDSFVGFPDLVGVSHFVLTIRWNELRKRSTKTNDQ
jgi:hypothetical protein